jgi:hypothetical protein
MQYLGTLSGSGCILHDGLEVTRADFKFDGYSTSYAGVGCSGEVTMPAAMLKAVFALRTLQLRTDEGRNLEVRFSDNKLGVGQVSAHVDVRGEIPGEDKREWNKARTTLPPSAGDGTERSDLKSPGGSSGAMFYSSFGTRDARSRKVSK